MLNNRGRDKIINVQTKTTVNESGENLRDEKTEKILIAQEPSYIKLYLDTLLTFKELPKQMSPLLWELLKLMSFADPDSEHGGQLIQLTGFSKKSIANRLNIKINTIDHGLIKLKKSGIIKQLGTGAYQANPNMFGRGDWADIKVLRASFDFIDGTVDANIVGTE